MKRIEVDLPEALVDALERSSDAEFPVALERVDGLLRLSHRHAEGRLRTFFAYYLLTTGSLILIVSLVLIVHAALGRSALESSAVATLIGSVAVEFVGMLYLVVRYLFREER